MRSRSSCAEGERKTKEKARGPCLRDKADVYPVV